eukprot:1484620-Rhodomonas_salina.1
MQIPGTTDAPSTREHEGDTYNRKTAREEYPGYPGIPGTGYQVLTPGIPRIPTVYPDTNRIQDLEFQIEILYDFMPCVKYPGSLEIESCLFLFLRKLPILRQCLPEASSAYPPFKQPKDPRGYWLRTEIGQY